MEPKRKGLDLAIIFGKKMGKGGKPPKPTDSEDEDDTEDKDDDKSEHDEDDELPPGFEEAAIEAFPELEGEPDRLIALKRAIHACTDSY